ncbi:PREDICTED: epidermal growth factor receptor substrate 15-like, partial [Pterocles gutturalis]|uniref:epidermal growth factor receptor substrate 15-like n=1 Tax=Pterocles gutturalis TaxID=240206 RepID=UPI0005285A9D
EFFVALRLVACAQNGLDVSLSSLNLPVPPPRFTDTSSPLLRSGTTSSDVPWAVKLEDKAKYDAIFDSLNPVNGLLSGDKVKPVLLNSKLPVDILGRVWELSDIDRDGMLDRDEFAVAMSLVYCALEKEPVPMSLPATLVPPSKRKPISVPGAMPLIPSSTATKESRQSLPRVGILTPLTQWVVSPADKIKYDEIFVKTDKDMDGFVSGVEARELFLKTGLPSALLAHIWALCDTKDCGKLSKEQFALAFYLINQKLTKGIDPPQALTPEMIPPSDRGVSLQKVRMGLAFFCINLKQ